MTTSINFPSIQNPSYPYEPILTDSTIKAESEYGYEHTRPMNTRVQDSFNLNWVAMPLADWLTFKSFYNTTLVKGALSFNFTDLLTNETKEYRFSGPPTVQSENGLNFKISAQIKEV